MKKSIEMKRKLEELKNTIKGLQDQMKIDEAHAKLSELTELKNAIAVQEALEEDEVQNFNGNQIQVREDKMNVNRIFNKMLLGKSVTEEEREFLNAAGTPGQVEATDGKGGYLVPVEQFNEIKELRRELVSLKGLCNVVPVTSLTGTLPIEKPQSIIFAEEPKLLRIRITVNATVTRSRYLYWIFFVLFFVSIARMLYRRIENYETGKRKQEIRNIVS